MAFSPLRGAMDGLLLAAVGVVAVAVLGLARSLCTDRRTKSIAIGALIMAAILARSPWGWTPIALGAIAGIVFLRDTPGLPATDLRVPFGRRSAAAALVIFVLLIIGVVTAGDRNRDLFLVATCLRAGSLVFGGGHVVLPLLARLVNARLVTGYDFFAGYGAAQAVPGPLFTFASFLGEKNSSALHGGIGALVATVAIFVPSFLLLAGIIPFWEAIRRLNGAGAALRGANAAVVGVLGAILYNPMLGLVYTPSRLAIALGAFLLIGVWNIAPWIVVVLCALAGAIFPYVAS
jgi:chromate transporter